VNVQVVTDPEGRLLWLSPALPGRAHDSTAARTHKIIRICERQGISILADLAYQGAGRWLTTGIKRRPLQELTPTENTLNQALAAARAPVERGVARLKSWRIFRRSRCSPKPHDVNGQCRPHPGAATLNKPHFSCRCSRKNDPQVLPQN
jgi:hypothetical protein